MRKVRGNDVSMIFQDPMTLAEPDVDGRAPDRRGGTAPPDVTQKQALAQAREVLDLVGMPRPEERLNYVPAPTLGRAPPARDDRHGARLLPKLLIADEPTTALDVTIQAQILDLIDSLRRDLKMAVILITHDLGVIARARTA